MASILEADVPAASAKPGLLNRVAASIQGLHTTARSFPSTVIWPILFFCVACGTGIWAVIHAARGAASYSQVRALSLANDAAQEYQQMLALVFSLTTVLRSLVQHNPKYGAVVHLFNATAPALVSTAPMSCVRALRLAPAAVIRQVYPLAGNEFLLGRDLLADPDISGAVLHYISGGGLAIEGPVPPTNGEREGGPLLEVRHAIHVNVTDPWDTFDRPDSPNPHCGALCDYNAANSTKFWGTTAVVVDLSMTRVPVGGGLMVSAPLRTLAALGYHYALIAPPGQQRYGSDDSSNATNHATGTAAHVVVESSPGDAGPHAVAAAVELGGGLQWKLLVGPPAGHHSWMPRWYGGVLAAVILASLALALLLLWLLVSRQRQQMLLQSLLPAELIRDLQTENDQAPLEPKPIQDAETPADVLMGLLSALLSGLPADLRDVVLLRTVLKRRLDVYRPFNLGTRMKEAHLDNDVTRALLRQLGSPADLCRNSSSGSTGPWPGGRGYRGSLSGSGSHDSRSNSDDDECYGYSDNGGGGGDLRRQRRYSTNRNGGQRILTSVLGQADPQQQQQELAAKCQSFKGALSFILSGSLREKHVVAAAPAVAGGRLLGDMREDCGTSYTAAANLLLGRVNVDGRRRSKCESRARLHDDDDLLLTTDLEGGGGGRPPPSAASRRESCRSVAVGRSSDSDDGDSAGCTAEAVAEATASVAAAEWAAAARRSRIMSIGGVASPPTVQQRLQRTLSRQTSATDSKALHNAWSCPQQPDLPLSSPPAARPKSGFMSYLRTRVVAAEVPSTEGRNPLLPMGPNGGGGDDGYPADSGGFTNVTLGGGLEGTAAACNSDHGGSVTSRSSAIGLRALPSLMIPGNVPPSADDEDQQQQQQPQQQLPSHLHPQQPKRQQRQQQLQQQVMFRLSQAQQRQEQRQDQQEQHQTGELQLDTSRDPHLLISKGTMPIESPPRPASMFGFSRSRRRRSSGSHVGQPPVQSSEGAGMPTRLLSTIPLASNSKRAHASAMRRGEPCGKTEALLLRAAAVAVPSSTGLNSYTGGNLELEDEGGEVVMAGAAMSSTTFPRQVVRAAPPPRPLVEDVERLLSEVDSWQFDTWGLQEASGGHALSALGFFVMHREGLLGRLRLEPLRLARLLRTLESGYPASNPYHNSVHAADVLHTLHVLVHGARLTSHYLDPLGLMAAYFAAIVHDFGHPGLTNDFLVATSHPLALRYNDRSPLENHHAAAAFTLLAQRPDLDITAGLSKQDRAAFRKQVIEMVLATDMKQHFAILNQFNTVHRLAVNYVTHGLPLPPPPGLQRAQETAQYIVPPKPLNEAERLLTLQVMLKAADIGHLGAGMERHQRWLSVLEEEFFLQGDRERQLGLPISPLFDRAKQGVSKSQVGFYDFVALPLLRAAAEAFPGAAPLLHCFKSNYQHWCQAAQAEAAAPAAAASGGGEAAGREEAVA